LAISTKKYVENNAQNGEESGEFYRLIFLLILIFVVVFRRLKFKKSSYRQPLIIKKITIYEDIINLLVIKEHTKHPLKYR
jgi:hypothetical protein